MKGVANNENNVHRVGLKPQCPPLQGEHPNNAGFPSYAGLSRNTVAVIRLARSQLQLTARKSGGGGGYIYTK